MIRKRRVLRRYFECVFLGLVGVGHHGPGCPCRQNANVRFHGPADQAFIDIHERAALLLLFTSTTLDYLLRVHCSGVTMIAAGVSRIGTPMSWHRPLPKTSAASLLTEVVKAIADRQLRCPARPFCVGEAAQHRLCSVIAARNVHRPFDQPAPGRRFEPRCQLADRHPGRRTVAAMHMSSWHRFPIW